MPVYAIPGYPILEPTSARAGGTALEGIVDELRDPLTVLIPFQGKYVRTGLGAKGGIETRTRHELPITLLLPFKNLKSLAQARTLIFNWLTTSGTGLAPHGGTATKPLAAPPHFPLIVRPIDAVEPHLYSPSWRIAEVAELQMIYAADVSHIEGNFLPLVSNQLHGATKRSWMMDTYQNINTEYAWTEPA